MQFPSRTMLAAAILSIALLSAAHANATTITFDELPYQSVDGVSYNGVTFHFSIGGVTSTDAFYDSTGPGVTQYLNDPSLEGNASGSLRLDFVTPQTSLIFGVGLSTGQNVLSGLHVALLGSGGSPVGSSSLDLLVGTSFIAENRYTYSGPAFSSAVLSFNNSAAPRFAIDNLTYTPSAVPVPAAVWLLGSGFIGLMGVARTRQA
jgi:hypothetical protein